LHPFLVDFSNLSTKPANIAKMLTRRGKAADLGRLFLELTESEWGATQIASYLDCETLARFACASQRTLAMNKTVGPLVARWTEAADALDKLFSLIRVGNIEYDSGAGFDQWEEVSGHDPRYEFMFSAIKELCSPNDSYVTNEGWVAGEAAWKRLDPMYRVSLMMS